MVTHCYLRNEAHEIDHSKYDPRGAPCVLTPPRAAQPSSPSYFGSGLAAACIVPPPRSRASPSTKKIRGVCSLRPATWHYPLFSQFIKIAIPQPAIKHTTQKSMCPVANPSFKRLKGGGTAHGHSRGQRGS